MRIGNFLVFVFLAFAGIAPAAAQNAWVQIQAHPNQPDAEAAARAFSRDLPPLEGYRLRSGWYALAIGPLTAAEAPTVLRQLRATGRIPADSYVVDGSRFVAPFWPPDGVQGAAATMAQPAIAPADPAQPGEESAAEARRAEDLLSRAEKMELQSALAWRGHYTAGIDGAIGRGSRSAMAAWQTANGYEATGVMTTAQRGQLMAAYRDMLAGIGLASHRDAKAGIEIDLPLGLVAFDRYDPPFVKFRAAGAGADDGIQAMLISLRGGRDSLAALYDVLQTLELVPEEGERRLDRNGFFIRGANDRTLVDIRAELAGDAIKGYMLIWPTGADAARRDLVLARMRQSFTPMAGSVLADGLDAGSGRTVDLLAGLAIRRPASSQTGFYVAPDGAVLTVMSSPAQCGRMTLGPDDVPTEIAAVDEAAGLALLRPRVSLAPPGLAGFDRALPRIGDEVAVSGYSFGGRLLAPSLTFGTLDDIAGLNAEPGLRRLSLPAEDGDAGGPVVARSGAVLGMLLPRATGPRRLPDGVHLAIGAAPLAEFLAGQGIRPGQAPAASPYPTEELAALTGGMTVLVNCWN